MTPPRHRAPLTLTDSGLTSRTARRSWNSAAGRWADAHRAQLSAIGFPPALHPVLHAAVVCREVAAAARQRARGRGLELAAAAGAEISGGSLEMVAAMHDYGMQLGMAFQIMDDALDYAVDADAMGKNAGDDFADQKITFFFLC